MLKRRIMIAVAVFIVLVVPISVFAATSDTAPAKTIRGFFGIDTSKLTDQQKADVKDYTQKMADLQKDFINKMVENGALTKEQGDAAVKSVDEMQKASEEKGFIPGFGMGKGGFGGRGKRDMTGIGKIDTSKLTDQQKADLKDTYKKMAELQKELVSKMASNGLMTKEQGDAALKKIDEISKSIDESDFAKGIKMFMGGFGGFYCFGLNDIDTSKLTDQQKADLTDFSKKMADLQKELINKMVSSGLLTKEQGDAAIKRIDEMLDFQIENGFTKGFGMKKGRFGKHMRPGCFNPEGNAEPVI